MSQNLLNIIFRKNTKYVWHLLNTEKAAVAILSRLFQPPFKLKSQIKVGQISSVLGDNLKVRLSQVNFYVEFGRIKKFRYRVRSSLPPEYGKAGLHSEQTSQHRIFIFSCNFSLVFF